MNFFTNESPHIKLTSVFLQEVGDYIADSLLPFVCYLVIGSLQGCGQLKSNGSNSFIQPFLLSFSALGEVWWWALAGELRPLEGEALDMICRIFAGFQSVVDLGEVNMFIVLPHGAFTET